eukprot:9526419-Lingulodinium_polyedra.AAC.1
MHRVWQCPATMQLQLPTVLKSSQLEPLATEAQPQELAFWGRGLIPWPWLGLSEPSDTMIVRAFGICAAVAAGTVDVADKVVFLDESGGPFSADPRLRRCGWGLALLRRP